MEEKIKTVVYLQHRTDSTRVTLFVSDERLILSKAGGSKWGAIIGGALLAGPVGVTAAVVARHVYGVKKADAVARLAINDIFDVDKKAFSIYFKDIKKIEFGRWLMATTLKVKTDDKDYAWVIIGLPKSMMSEEEQKKSSPKNYERACQLLKATLPEGLLLE